MTGHTITKAGFARPLETRIEQLPFAFRLAIEWLDCTGEQGRNRTRLTQGIEHYLRATGSNDLTSNDIDHYTDSAAGICSRRFWNWEAA